MDITYPYPAAESKAQLPDGVAITPRRFENTDFNDVPKYWFGSSPFCSLQLDILSLIIPAHEKFFIHTLRAVEEDVEDQETKELVRAFIQQEAAHYKVHQIYNDTRKQYGINVDRELRLMEKVFDAIKNYVPLKIRLGMTSFMEHYTATGAHLLLAEQEPEKFMHQTMLDLWRWHAVEELEHKAVAFDLFEKLGGNYFYRIISFFLTSIIIGTCIGIISFRTFRDDRLWRRYNVGAFTEEEEKEQAEAREQIFNNTGLGARILFAYLKPNFHPWELNDSGLIKTVFNEQVVTN